MFYQIKEKRLLFDGVFWKQYHKVALGLKKAKWCACLVFVGIPMHTFVRRCCTSRYDIWDKGGNCGENIGYHGPFFWLLTIDFCLETRGI